MPSINDAGGYRFTTLVLPAKDRPSHRPAYPSSTAQTIDPDSFDPTRPEGSIVRTINGWPLVVGQEGEEPRIPATILGRRLGHTKRQTTIDLIDRNRKELESHGELTYRRIVRQWLANGATRETLVDEPYLNKEQALVIAMRANTPESKCIWSEIIEVYTGPSATRPGRRRGQGRGRSEGPRAC